MRILSEAVGRFSPWLTVPILLTAFAIFAAAQSSSESTPKNAVPAAASGTIPATDENRGNPAAGPTVAKSAKIAANDPRQAQIVADTSRLLQLAQELKVEVAKSNKEILSLAVVKKADEIEKLAKSLKERLRTE